MTPTARAIADGFGARLALFYAGLFVVVGIQMPFFPLWLAAKGLDAEAIGVVIAAPIAVRLVVVPVVARIADRRGGGGRGVARGWGGGAAACCFVGGGAGGSPAPGAGGARAAGRAPGS